MLAITMAAFRTALLAACCVGGAAWACKCDPDVNRDPRKHPSVIFEGKVLRVGQNMTSRRTPLWGRLAQFEVARVLQGEVPSPVHVLTGEGGGDCGLDLHPGETWTIYAITNERDAGQGLYADTCTASALGTIPTAGAAPIRLAWGVLGVGLALLTASLALLRRQAR